MDLLIHDLAAAIERDATDDYTSTRSFRSDDLRREPLFRMRSDRIDPELSYLTTERVLVETR